MTDQSLKMGRESRHISLSQIGEQGQKLISDATILIVGMGGLGCASANYLNSSGIKKMFICDFDSIDATNLGRQVLFGPSDIGKQKVLVAKQQLEKINPKIDIQTINKKINQQALMSLDLVKNTIILDCSDNFNTRFEINKYCVKNNHYLVSGSAIRFEGQYAVFGDNYKKLPCYECLYNQNDESYEDCAGNGVLGPIPGMIGAMMAIETIKIICNIYTEKTQLNIYEGLSNEWRQINIKKRQDCPICN